MCVYLVSLLAILNALGMPTIIAESSLKVPVGYCCERDMSFRSSVVRESKYRHIHVACAKREEHYENLRLSTTASDGNLITCNSLFLAYLESAAGAIAVLPLHSVGKNHVPVMAPSYQQPLIRGHSSPVQDIAFSGFSSQKHKLFSCSSDSTLKIWEIPEKGYVVDSNSPVSVYTAGSALRAVACHTTAEDIVAVRGSRDVTVLDTSGSEIQEKFKISSDVFGANDLQSLSWSFDGSTLLTTGKDKILRQFDVRSSMSPVTQVTSFHGGNRNSRCTWLGPTPYLFTCGHTFTQDREIALWDSRNLEKPVKRERVDSSTGTLMPFYDPDTCLLTLAGKGDTSARLFEFDGTSGSIHAISSTPLGEVTKGASLLPKQANNFMSCEVLRLLRLTENSAQPVSYQVPRKEKLKFHDDLFPPTFWETPASLSASEWLGGENKIRIPIPLGVSAAGTTTRNVSSEKSTAERVVVASTIPASTSVSETPPPPPLESSSVPTPPVVASPTHSPRASSGRPASTSFGPSIKYKHMHGTEHPKSGQFFNIKPDTSMDSPLIACSDIFWAIPYVGGGGPVYVSKLDAFGKVEPTCPVVNGHKQSVLDIAFSPFHSHIMATASDDSTVKIWQLDDSTGVTKDMDEGDAVANLATHRHAVRTCNFHPTVEGLLFTSSLDLTVRSHDINSGKEVGLLNMNLVEGGQVSNLTFNYDGSLIAAACKDKTVRIADPRQNNVVLSISPSTYVPLGRNLRAEWCSFGKGMGSVCTVSSGSTGMRQLCLWDSRSMSKPTCTISIDNASGQLFPLYDEGVGMIYLAGKGDTIIRGYEMTFLDAMSGATAVKACEFQTSKEPIAGVCLLPKRLMDVRKIEVARILKLTTDTVCPISLNVPRADILMEYFQDDIFVPTRSKIPSASVSDWTSPDEINLEPEFDSMQPEGMMAMSFKPEGPVRVSKIVEFRQSIEKSEQESKIKDNTFSRLQNLAIQRSKYHPNASGGGHGFKCDATPIHMTAAADEEPEVGEDEWD